MPRDYWPTTETKYGMPVHLADTVKNLVRDYDRMKDEYIEVLEKSPDPQDGQPRGGGRSDTTSAKGMRCAELSRKTEAVEQGIRLVPEEYRQGVWEHAVYGIKYPMDADLTTYRRHKASFMRAVAKRLYWL